MDRRGGGAHRAQAARHHLEIAPRIGSPQGWRGLQGTADLGDRYTRAPDTTAIGTPWPSRLSHRPVTKHQTWAYSPAIQLGRCLRRVTAISWDKSPGVDRSVDRRPWESQCPVCVHGMSHEASFARQAHVTAERAFLIRWFRVRPLAPPPSLSRRFTDSGESCGPPWLPF